MAEAAALGLLLAHQSGILNPIVDVLVPIYTVAVIVFIYTVHKQQKLLSEGVVPSDEYLYDAGEVAIKADMKEDKVKEEEVAEEGSRPDYTGVWKTIPAKNVNYDEFLAFQGVPYLKRKVACSSVITHAIKHTGNTLNLEVQPLDMKTTFNIDGEPSASYIGKKPFTDRMTWGSRGELVLVKSNAEDGTEITATRLLKDQGKTLVMKQVAKNLKDGKVVQAEQTFHRAD